jgi:hypothetical protein
MSSTITQIKLGADLVIKAVTEDVKGYLSRSENETNEGARAQATLALRGLSKWQIDNGILVQNDDGNYEIKEKALDNLSDMQVQEGGAYYDDAIKTHIPLAPDMYLSGKQDYINYFSEVHNPVNTQILIPEERVTQQSLEDVTTASLSFVEAAYKNPSIVDNIPGIATTDVDQMVSVLSDAGYLVPGENDEREKPLSEQTPRGTHDQQMAIFEMAATISSNMELPKTSGLDLLAANQLKTAVDTAESEEVTSSLEGPKLSDLTPINSDLQKEDIGNIYMSLLIGASIINKAQPSTETSDLENEIPMVVIPAEFEMTDKDGTKETIADIVNVFDNQMKGLDEEGVIDSVNRGGTTKTSRDFAVPGLAPTDNQLPYVASTLKDFFKAAKIVASYVQDEEDIIDGDSGARSLQSVDLGSDTDFENEGSSHSEDEFERDIDLEEDGDTGLTTAGIDSPAMDNIDPIYRKAPEAEIEKMRKSIEILSSMGVLNRMATMIGREDKNDDEIFNGDGSGVLFGSLDEFSQGGDMHEDDKNQVQNTFSFHNVRSKGKDFEDNLKKQGVVFIEEDKGIFAKSGYSAGSASAAPKRVAEFVKNNMFDDNGKPNFQLRATMRKIADRGVVTSTIQAADAWKSVSTSFIAREREEHDLRLKAADEKSGVWTMGVSKTDLKRVEQVAKASGNSDPFRLVITEDGGYFTREDTPKIKLSAHEGIPDEIKKAQSNSKLNRPLGGMLSLDSIQGALENMDDKEKTGNVVIHGEAPRGITSQMITARKKAMEKTKGRKGIEPDLPATL